jgi:hypothetical protein
LHCFIQCTVERGYYGFMAWSAVFLFRCALGNSRGQEEPIGIDEELSPQFGPAA